MLRALRTIAVVAYALSLVAVCVCPCPMPMAAEDAAHDCCTEPGLRAAPMACCAMTTSGASLDPALPNVPQALTVAVVATAMPVFTAPQVLVSTVSTHSFVPASPPRILRI